MVVRVFPRRTKATPCDDNVRIGYPDMWDYHADIELVQISVAFSWDVAAGYRLQEAWQKIAPTDIGGPAFMRPSGDFVGGRFLRDGYTITSRGCPNDCWFCRVPKAEGALREVPIVSGYNVLDDNILACSQRHFSAVIEMLRNRRERAQFTGGLDASLLTDWHVDQLASLKPRPICFFAYDPGDTLDELRDASIRMQNAGWTHASHRLRCYVLIGWPSDSFDEAEQRLSDVLDLGFTPMAMLWRSPKSGVSVDQEWKQLQRLWCRPAIIHSRRTKRDKMVLN